MSSKAVFWIGVFGSYVALLFLRYTGRLSEEATDLSILLLLRIGAIVLGYYILRIFFRGLARLFPYTSGLISTPVKRWLRRPLWGYRRLQVILNLMLWGIVLGNLLWTYDWSGKRPPYVLSSSSDDLRNYRNLAGLPDLSLDAFLSISPGTDTAMPYPLASEVFAANSLTPSITKIMKSGSRILMCDNRSLSSNEKPCELLLSAPLSIDFDFRNRPEMNTSTGEKRYYLPIVVKRQVSNLQVKMTWSPDQLYIERDLGTLRRYQDRDFFETSIPDLADWGRNSIKLGLFFKAVSERSITTISARVSEKEVEKDVHKGCEFLGIPSSSCPIEYAETIPCKMVKTGLPSMFCSSLDEFDVAGKADETTGNISSRSEVNFPLDRVEDRAFFVLFANHLGYKIEYRPDEAVFLKGLADEIRSDYAIIMGAPQAGNKAMDRRAIRSALIRQIQLYPYYEDREEWRPIIMKDLEAKLSEMGFPVEPLSPEKTP